jgi:hypothetical protein
MRTQKNAAKTPQEHVQALHTQAIEIDPDYGVEIPDNITYMALTERAEAAFNTIKQLEEYGLITTPDDEDNEVAAILAESYAKDIEKTSKAVSNNNLASMTPASIKQTALILQEFGSIMAGHAAEIRNTVVNKLLLETENTDGRIRIRALELLGKMTDVGLFTERKEITVTHQNAEEVRQKLREKLETLKQNADGVYEMTANGE